LSSVSVITSMDVSVSFGRSYSRSDRNAARTSALAALTGSLIRFTTERFPFEHSVRVPGIWDSGHPRCARVFWAAGIIVILCIWQGILVELHGRSLAAFDSAPIAAATARLFESAASIALENTDRPNAAQSALNSRRSGNLIFLILDPQRFTNSSKSNSCIN
jgi:hypothetical protein